MSKLKYKFLQEDIKKGTFDCGVSSINEFIVDSFFATLLQHGYAYQILYSNKEYKDIVVGYYMITFSHVMVEECPETISDYTTRLNDFLYCVEIKYLAIDKKYQHKRIGTSVLPTIIKSIKDYALSFPIRLITIDARNDLVNWYKKMGFIEFPQNKEGQEGVTTRMYIDCLIRKKELDEYVNSYY